jgi:hypothetical protein
MEKITASITNFNFYPLIMKSVCLMIDRGINADKINFISKPAGQVSSIEKIKQYEAFCQIELDYNCQELLENVEYVKHSNKKKPIKAPEFDSEMKLAKLYQRTPEHNVLIYDKSSELVIRNKILECCLRVICTNEIESKPIFKNFNNLYDTYVSSNDIYNITQFYSYSNNITDDVNNNNI